MKIFGICFITQFHYSSSFSLLLFSCLSPLSFFFFLVLPPILYSFPFLVPIGTSPTPPTHTQISDRTLLAEDSCWGSRRDQNPREERCREGTQLQQGSWWLALTPEVFSGRGHDLRQSQRVPWFCSSPLASWPRTVCVIPGTVITPKDEAVGPVHWGDQSMRMAKAAGLSHLSDGLAPLPAALFKVVTQWFTLCS